MASFLEQPGTILQRVNTYQSTGLGTELGFMGFGFLFLQVGGKFAVPNILNPIAGSNLNSPKADRNIVMNSQTGELKYKSVDYQDIYLARKSLE